MQAIPPVSTLHQKPVLQASKWNAVQALVSLNELQALFGHLENPQIYFCGSLWNKEAFAKHNKLFFEAYGSYIQSLSKGEQPDLAKCRTFFSACMTNDQEVVYIQDVKNEEFLLRPFLPIIQIQHHTMSFSTYDGKVHSMVFGKDAISWGLQFSYPQMYLDGNTGRLCQVSEEDSPPNHAMFKALQRWMRNHTVPTGFQSEDQTVRSSLRLGKECQDWIHLHPQLVEQNIHIV